MRELNAGDKLDQYKLVELLARSGMASIFEAIDTESNATVALKIPHMQFESDVVFFERFRREEEIGQRLNHPAIIKVLKPLHKSRMYMAMEYVGGLSLRAVLNDRRSLPADEALGIVMQLCDALIYLHAHGVVHRDIKPENLLVTPSGQIKLLDFGIALDESARRLTWVGLSSTVGTPDYMAPEQIAGRRGDVRTDVYAVGTMLYEMLTGNLPHASPNPHALLRAKTTEDPKPPSYYLPTIDPSLETVVLKAIERAPRDRYQTMADLLVDLRDPSAVQPRDPDTGGANPRKRRPPSRLGMPLTVAAVLLGLASLVWLSHRHTPEPRRSSAMHRER